MIRLKEPCVVECDYEIQEVPGPDGHPAGRCTASAPGHLVLTSMGTFLALPDAKVAAEWDCLPMAINQRTMVMMCRCPKHKFTEAEKTPVLIQPAKMQVGPAGVRPMNGNGKPRG